MTPIMVDHSGAEISAGQGYPQLLLFRSAGNAMRTLALALMIALPVVASDTFEAGIVSHNLSLGMHISF
jgi:hypothetical protein